MVCALKPAAAQRTAVPAPPTWKAVYPSKFYDGTTSSERAAIMATLGEIERILVPCGYPDPVYRDKITIAPAHLELELLSLTAGTAAAEKRLLRALQGVTDDFDLVVIETPGPAEAHVADFEWLRARL